MLSTHVENVAMLYLLNQDTKALNLDELYALYCETLEQVKDSEKHYQESHKENPFSFD